MDTVHINLGNDSYDVMIDSGIIGRLWLKKHLAAGCMLPMY